MEGSDDSSSSSGGSDPPYPSPSSSSNEPASTSRQGSPGSPSMTYAANETVFHLCSSDETGSVIDECGVAVGSATQAGIEPSKPVTMLVPQRYMGFVHGESDGNLALIREVSGADVTIHDPEPGTHEGTIVISGSQRQTSTAQGLVHAFILNEL